MSVQGVSHDKLKQYRDTQLEALTSLEARDVSRYLAQPTLDRALVAATVLLLRNRDQIRDSYTELKRATNAPNPELVIIGPAHELGPLPDDVRFLGLPVRPEHSATDYRVVWERRV